jgi:hypothetical protein
MILFDLLSLTMFFFLIIGMDYHLIEQQIYSKKQSYKIQLSIRSVLRDQIS